MKPADKAKELVEDCLQIQLPNIDLLNNYEMAKVQAEYSANVAKWSNPNKHHLRYWQQVKEEIEKL